MLPFPAIGEQTSVFSVVKSEEIYASCRQKRNIGKRKARSHNRIMFSYTIGRTAVLLFALSSLSIARAMAAGDVPVPDNQTYKEIENKNKIV